MLLLLLGGAATCWSIWLSRNDIVFEKKKNCLSCVGYLFGYPLATYLGQSAEAGFAGYSCSGIATIDAGGQGFFSPRHMGGGLVYELIVTRLCKVFSLSLAMCLMLGRG
jgi:hypothetical protein